MKFKILLLFLHFFTFGISQEVPPKISVVIDSVVSKSGQYKADSLLKIKPSTDNLVYPKSFDSQFRSKYKGQDFDYTTVRPRESLWQKIQKRIIKILESIFGEVDPSKASSYAATIMRIFGILIIGFVLYVLVKFLLNKEGNFFFGKNNKKIDIRNQDLHENIHEINFKEAIEGYEKQKDYRSAIRYQFLLILKKLTDHKHLNWNPEKTNKDYLAEVQNESLKSSFKELVYIFDYVWYGEFEVNEDNYNHFKQKFLKFKI